MLGEHQSRIYDRIQNSSLVLCVLQELDILEDLGVLQELGF
jgi:hypothetical protein